MSFLKILIENSTFTDNKAILKSSLHGGGAIYIEANVPSLFELIRVLFTVFLCYSLI